MYGKVRNDLRTSVNYYCEDKEFYAWAVTDMLKAAGKFVKLEKNGHYYFVLNIKEVKPYCWTDEMFDWISESGVEYV